MKYRLCTPVGFSNIAKHEFRFRLTKNLRRKFFSRSRNLTKILTNEVGRIAPQSDISLKPVEDLESDEYITNIVQAFRRSVLHKTITNLKIDEIASRSWESQQSWIRAELKKAQAKVLDIKVEEVKNIGEVKNINEVKIEGKEVKEPQQTFLENSFYVALVCDQDKDYCESHYEKVELKGGTVYRRIDSNNEQEYCEAFFSDPVRSFVESASFGDTLESVLEEFSSNSTTSYQGMFWSALLSSKTTIQVP